jgi:hypothetical protein
LTAGPSTDILTFTIPPSFADIFLSKSANLTCLVSNLATYETLNISWASQSGEPLETKIKIMESHPNGTFSAKGVASVCVEDWNNRKEFVCTVTHRDLPSPQKKFISKPNGRYPPFPSPPIAGPFLYLIGRAGPLPPYPHYCLHLQRCTNIHLLCTCCHQLVSN